MLLFLFFLLIRQPPRFTLSVPSFHSSVLFRSPATNDSAVSRWPLTSVSRPPTRNLIWSHAKPSRSDVVKNLRAARPRAKWKIDAPPIIVLSTDRKSVGWGKKESVRVDLGGRRINKKNNNKIDIGDEYKS